MRFWSFLLFGMVGTAVLIGLGLWQLQRLDWKQALLSEIDSRLTSPAIAVPATPDEAAHRFLQVTSAGRFGGERLYVLSSFKGIGPGYKVIERFETESGRAIMVDRGFLAIDRREAALHTGPARVSGTLHWPDEQDRYTPEPEGDLWFARDVPTMAETLNTEAALIIATAVSPADPNLTPVPLDSANIPNNHLGYAVQWFGLAAVWASMSLWAAIKTRRQGA